MNRRGFLARIAAAAAATALPSIGRAQNRPSAFRFTDVTAKAGPMAGKRMHLDEAALYTVKDGKIIQEEFFYSMEG